MINDGLPASLGIIAWDRRLVPAILAPSWRRFLQRITTLHSRPTPLRRVFPSLLANIQPSRARARLFNFRHWYLPSLKLRLQSNIYRFFVSRNARKARLVSNPQGRCPTFWRQRYLKDGPELQRAKMASNGSWSTPAPSPGDYSAFRADGREPGTRRKKLAGYLKAANELRQSYFTQDGTQEAGRAGTDGVDGPGAFPDAAVVRNGNEEMILFPSYARKHTKDKPKPRPAAGEPQGSQQEFWRQEWERHQDDKAVVDVDVRGWVYTPHRGHANRRQRLMIGIARQLSGLPAPPTTKPDVASYDSATSSRASSPTRQEEDLITLEAENIVRIGEQESRFARRGAFSEDPVKDSDTNSLYDSEGPSASPDDSRGGRGGLDMHRLSQISLASSTDGESFAPPVKRDSWTQPINMSATELHIANRHLVNRLKPFMATPLANTPITAFFYNENASRQHTVYTNAAGHFSCRAALDFVPTHVRVLASENLSATEVVTVTSPTGVSMISDIDDTIKHSAISAGAREIFRTAFIRELSDLTIDGVREWYSTMSDMGVQLHYVSNSPWQMYPVLTSYFKLANLPKGSFHLKQYTGMLQGIFEPVAERKRANLEKIMRDFPDRKYILVGDSGEADLEVYTEVALENPGRVLGIFIRDVTTPIQSGYFDPSSGSGPGPGPGSGGRRSRNHSRQRSGDGDLELSKRLRRPEDTMNDDADLKAAMAASLADMEEETLRARRNINPDLPGSELRDAPPSRPALPKRPGDHQSGAELPTQPTATGDLIDLTDDLGPSKPWLEPGARRLSPTSYHSDLALLGKKPSPSPPPKPQQLRSPSPNSQAAAAIQDGKDSLRMPPPRPRKPSTAVRPSASQVQEWAKLSVTTSTPAMIEPSPLRQVTQQSPVDTRKERPPLPARPKSRLLFGNKDKGSFAAEPTPQFRSDAIWQQQRPPFAMGGQAESIRQMSSNSADTLRPLTAINPSAPAPPPRRRNNPVLPPGTILARKATNPSGGWDDLSGGVGGSGGGGSLPGSPSEAGMSRKEFLWMQRWARAKKILEPQGVTLRSWRVGADVADIAVKLTEMALRDMEKQRRDDEFRKSRAQV